LFFNNVAMVPSTLSLVVAHQLEERTCEIDFSDERYTTQHHAKVGGSHRHATTASLPSPYSPIFVATSRDHMGFDFRDRRSRDMRLAGILL
jgi:hypothetical protein